MIYSFADAIRKYPDAAICITSVYEDEIYAQIESYDKNLLSRTYKIKGAMIWEIFEKRYISEEADYILERLDSFEELYDMLEDETSRMTLENILNYRITRKEMYLAAYRDREENIYFDDTVLKGSDIKVYIDGGTFDGDTVKRFMKYVQGEYSRIYCFEAEPDSISKINELIQTEGIKDIEVYEKALWEEKDVLKFKVSGAGGSRIAEESDQDIEVEAIDIDSLDIPSCDLIKLDIEGAERRALSGMKNMIQRCHPNLAVSVYHKQDDLLSIPKLIKQLCPDYKLYLRQYLSTPVDTVLYAIYSKS